jgi:hypothetical protein
MKMEAELDAKNEAERGSALRKEVSPERQAELVTVVREATEEDRESAFKAVWEMFSVPKRKRLLRELTAGGATGRAL